MHCFKTSQKSVWLCTLRNTSYECTCNFGYRQLNSKLRFIGFITLSKLVRICYTCIGLVVKLHTINKIYNKPLIYVITNLSILPCQVLLVTICNKYMDVTSRLQTKTHWWAFIKYIPQTHLIYWKNSLSNVLLKCEMCTCYRTCRWNWVAVYQLYFDLNNKYLIKWRKLVQVLLLW